MESQRDCVGPKRVPNIIGPEGLPEISRGREPPEPPPTRKAPEGRQKFSGGLIAVKPMSAPDPSNPPPPQGAAQEIEDLFDDANGDLAVGELESAALKYRRCVELDASFFEGWHALGMALMKTGRYEDAIQAGLKCVDLRPDDQLAWSSLSLFYVRNGNIKEAEAAGAKARILSWGGKVSRGGDRA
jgi:tetratricopeptide (TPR) repeat protein